MRAPLDTGLNTPPVSAGGPPARNSGTRHRNSTGPRKKGYKGAKAKIPNSTWQPANALDLGLQPRSFEEIDSERTYHVDQLQKQDNRTLDLLRRLAEAEGGIGHSHESNNGRHELKKTRKHCAWLRMQIKKSINEERSIMMALGDLHVEIQCQERWFQIHGGQRYGVSFGDIGYHPPNYGRFPLPPPPFLSLGAPMPAAMAVATQPPWLVNSQPTMPFGTLCPCGCNGIWYQVNPPLAPGFFHHNYPGPPSCTQTQDAAKSPPIQKKPLRVRVDERLVKDRWDDESYSHVSIMYHTKKVRRWSLPSLHFEWVEEGEKNGNLHRCLGYDPTGLKS